MNHKEKVVKLFCKECIRVCGIREHFSVLYESGDTRKELLSEISKGFFSDLNIILQEYILLQKSKLTDPAESGKNKNLTTNYIVSLDWPKEIQQKLDAANAKIGKFREKIVDARRKLLAHSDLESHLERTQYGSFTVEDENGFWTALQEFVNTAHMAVFDEPCEIEVPLVDGDAFTLVQALKEAVDYSDTVNSEPGFLLSRTGKQRYEDA